MKKLREIPNLQDPAVLERVCDRHTTDRWAVLVGQPGEVLYEYLLGHLTEYPKDRTRPKRLHIGLAYTDFGADGEEHAALRTFLEQHMISATPAVLLVRKGNQEALITGAISYDRLAEALDDLCTNRPQDRIEDLLAEMDSSELPIHRTEAGYPRCSTCDGGGCLDCTDPA